MRCQGMKHAFALAALLAVARVMPVSAQPAVPTPGTPGNGQVGTGAVVLPPLASKNGASGAPTSLSGTPAAASGGMNGLQVLCPPAGATVTQPFFTGTDPTCAP